MRLEPLLDVTGAIANVAYYPIVGASLALVAPSVDRRDGNAKEGGEIADLELPPERHREEMRFLDADRANVLARTIDVVKSLSEIHGQVVVGPTKPGKRRTVTVPRFLAAELPEGLRFHDLRHTCAALLIAYGRHLEEVKDYLGHFSIRVTSDRYGHLFPKARAELVDALDTTYRNSAAGNPADSLRTAGQIVAFRSANQGPV